MNIPLSIVPTKPNRNFTLLLHIASRSLSGGKSGMVDISQKGATLRFTLEEFDLQAIANLGGQYPARLLFTPGQDKGLLTLKLKQGEDPLRVAQQLVERYTALLPQKEA